MYTCGMLRRGCRSLHMHICLMLRSTGVGWGGLTPRGAHIAGLSAVHIHRNLGFENVVQCFVKYIHHVRDTIPPASAFVDQTWLQS